MAQELVSIPKSSNSPGRPSGKKKYVILFLWSDVKTFEKDEKGIKVTTFEMQEGKTPIAVYATQSTIHCYDTMEGDPDAKGYIHKTDFEVPGDSVEVAELRNRIVNEELGAIVINCGADEDAKIAGSPCCPLLVSSDESQDNSEAKKNTINLASIYRSGPIGRIPLSMIPLTDNETINAELGLPAEPASE